ncbi:hypothetical protein OQJ46_06855 [Microbulbifer thermotolerans]|uniref:Peptidase C13 n=2 Tax=Microbulbifer thermotolerans TaxID=252514 RepID=A0AB35HSX2_MICTH|nr:C13 family peptidase [Microbulbifer thermotolerans]MCX2779112.1 hypothetical protein [Microbulbifer thermotolerans]MCX2782702.1 hypothetical protein [Microbulbifer thermotolerans]MCX2795644.1 hypothetical protein [Microbulbifer thermotolerans]MCX2800170.1 hypothetical protein [Microbulbifer thermotolerans]MCX2805256.1 hypothetical protein [Microbulbifer thermotolerans]
MMVLNMYRFTFTLPLLLLCTLVGCEPHPFAGGTALPDGSVYSGGMENGLFHGHGKLTWPDGRTYTGEFHRGRISGLGKFDYGDGCIYEGAFRNGELHGEGRYACEENIWEGDFEQGEIRRGTVSWDNGETYTGEFQDWQPHGRGLLTTAEGTEYEGRFENGLPVNGSYRDRLGYSYRGGFEYFQYAGEGELIQPDGTMVRANFEYGEANGEGVLILPDGTGELQEQKGFFVSGRYYPSEQAWRQSEQDQRSAVEARLYSEAERLQAQFSALAPQRPGVRDVYLLAVGGDGTSPVFAKEVEWVTERLGTVFDIEQRQIKLSNGGGDKYPLATRTSIRESLKALDRIMDPEEDLLLLHLVSHGDENGDFLLAEAKVQLNDLSVADAKQWLDALEVRHQWIVVSACYSGLWKEALAGPERTIFTSAAPDRTSFGCSDDSERTWFSAALYSDALDTGVNDPAAWFAAAKQRVMEMEKEQGIEEDAYSLPQLALGREFLSWWNSPN